MITVNEHTSCQALAARVDLAVGRKQRAHAPRVGHAAAAAASGAQPAAGDDGDGGERQLRRGGRVENLRPQDLRLPARR